MNFFHKEFKSKKKNYFLEAGGGGRGGSWVGRGEGG